MLELELEVLLRGRFPTDLVGPVGKCELGADVVRQVNGSIGQTAGMILWESKRTKTWRDGWLASCLRAVEGSSQWTATSLTPTEEPLFPLQCTEEQR